jgi:hypothetical protein
MPEITVEPIYGPQPPRHRALRYEPDGSNREEVLDFLAPYGQRYGDSVYSILPSPTKRVNPGDWVVKAGSGAYTQVLPQEVFATTFWEAPEEHCIDLRVYLRTGPDTRLAHASGSSARVIGSTLSKEALYELATSLRTHDSVRLALSLAVLEALQRASE